MSNVEFLFNITHLFAESLLVLNSNICREFIGVK